MRRVAIAGLVLLVLSASVIAGCGGSSESSSGSADLTLWTGFTDRELGVMKDVIADFEKTHPDIHVKVVGGISDDKIVAAIRGGNAPDVAHSFDAGAYTGAYCSNGAWIDLADYMKQDGLSDDVFPEVPRQYSQFEGTRCALPMLADVYGLYYNKDLLAKAGIDSPPQTVSQLMDDAKKLTERNPDGSLKVVGLDPFDGFYENVAAHWAPQWGVDWVDESGKSNLAAQPGWAAMLRWQKELIDWYGYDNLVRWQASAGDEFSAQNAFERGKLAMNLDGEWRVAFVQSEHPELNFATAPLPVDDAQPDLYGSGYTSGSIIGIPKTSGHKDEAWQLLKYLATDTGALVKMTNGIRNVPTTTDALESPDVKPDEAFNIFLDIFGNPNTRTTPITLVGSANQDLVDAFVTKYQAGKVDDLEGGLADLDQQIDAQLEAAGGAQVP
jgi:multiple sugar transport system substrate-binding protein